MEPNIIKNDKVYILGCFDESIASNVVPEFVELINKKKLLKNPEIEIYINSYGGNVKDLYSMLTLISEAKRNNIRIITYNMGVANSCGSMLFVHGDVRKMYKYSTNLIHLGICSDSFTTVEQLKRGFNRLNSHFENIINMYVEHTKMKRKDIEKYLKDDKFTLNAEMCLKYGICDEII